MTTPPRASQALTGLRLLGAPLPALLLLGCGALTFATAGPEPGPSSAPPIDMDRLLFVDCLLQGQIRKNGGRMTYIGPRRRIRTTVDDCDIRRGEYVASDPSDYAAALKVWLPEAERGEEQAEIYVGEIYEKGPGTAPDYARAAEWYEKASKSKQQSKQGMSHLAYLYEQGLGVARDTVRALNASTCPVLLYSRNPALGAASVLRPRRSIGFGDENVTVWKNVKPTRMVEADREGLDRKAGRGRGARALRPTLRWGDIDGGDDRFRRLGQRGIWPKRCLLRQFGAVPTGGRG